MGFVRCCIANRATLAGYMLIPTALTGFLAGLAMDRPISGTVASCAAGALSHTLLRETDFGRATHASYQAVREAIESEGDISARHLGGADLTYSQRVGRNLALEESGLGYYRIFDPFD